MPELLVNYMRWNLSQNKKTEEFRGGNWVWKQSTIYLNVSLTQYALWYFSIVSKIPPVKQHMDCNVSLEPLTLPSCAHNPGFAHNVRWPRIGHLAEGNDPWPNGQCQFLTFQCQCLVRDGEDIGAAAINLNQCNI